MEHGYERSLETLLPIEERLAKTDWLIDQIVYKLYGLTEEEIAIVEGRRSGESRKTRRREDRDNERISQEMIVNKLPRSEVIYMQNRKLDAEVILERVSEIEKTLEYLKRDIIKGIEPSEEKERISLFGSVKGGDVTEEIIDEAKRSLFRDLEDI
jgi:hypothetical protein